MPPKRPTPTAASTRRARKPRATRRKPPKIQRTLRRQQETAPKTRKPRSPRPRRSRARDIPARVVGLQRSRAIWRYNLRHLQVNCSNVVFARHPVELHQVLRGELLEIVYRFFPAFLQLFLYGDLLRCRREIRAAVELEEQVHNLLQ